MLSKNNIKLIQSLRYPKYRQEHGLFVAEGVKVVEELLSGNFLVKAVFATAEFQPTADYKNDFYQISHAELERISHLKTPNQVLALVKIPEPLGLAQIENKDLTLALDRISDPGNFGSIIRTADWFGIRQIICSPDCVDVYNPKVVQATMGSIARVKVIYVEVTDYLFGLENKLPVYGAVLGGENLYQQNLPENAVIVIGNESQGISGKLLPHITTLVTIPGYDGGSGANAESLNASVATALICSEFRRQHSQSNF